MYALVRRYAGKGGLIDGLAPRVRDGLVPLLKEAPGLRGHCTFVGGEGQGRVVAVSVFGTRENAMLVSDQVVGIMRERAREMVPDAPRVTAGEAVVAAAA